MAMMDWSMRSRAKALMGLPRLAAGGHARDVAAAARQLNLAPSCYCVGALCLLAGAGLVNLRLLLSSGVEKAVDAHYRSLRRTRASVEELVQHVAIIVLPSPVKGPGSRADRLTAITRTWGRRQPDHVQVFFATEDRTVDRSPHLPGDAFVDLPEEEDGVVNNMERFRMSLSTAKQRMPHALWFFLCNDHTYVLPENLLCYLSTLDHTRAVYAGHRLTTMKTTFNSGGAGFVLSVAAVDLLLASMSAKEKACVPANDWEKMNAGLTLARCLLSHGVEPLDTRDDHQGERFHVYGPTRTAEAKVDPWFTEYHPDRPILNGTACCAADTISFHYVGPHEVLAIHELLVNQASYRVKPISELTSVWPSRWEDLGGYSAYPKAGSPIWDFILHKVELCSRSTT